MLSSRCPNSWTLPILWAATAQRAQLESLRSPKLHSFGCHLYQSLENVISTRREFPVLVRHAPQWRRCHCTIHRPGRPPSPLCTAPKGRRPPCTLSTADARHSTAPSSHHSTFPSAGAARPGTTSASPLAPSHPTASSSASTGLHSPKQQGDVALKAHVAIVLDVFRAML
jgi:hypothetical protein